MKDEQASPLCSIRVYLFGTLEVARRNNVNGWQSVSKSKWGKYGKAGRRILGRLLAAPGRRVGQGRLLDDLWPNTDSKSNLDNGLTALRAVIGKDLIETIDTFYQVADQALVWVDVDACDGLLKKAENQGHNALTVPLLEEALGYLERGEYLEGEDGIWCYGLRKKPEEMMRQCRLWLAEGYEQQGKLWQAGEQYRALCQATPPNEDALWAWMEMLARQGKMQDALKYCQEAMSFFEEQGYTLSPSFDALVQQIKAQSVSALHLTLSLAEEKETMRATPTLPEKAASLWQPNLDHPETALRFAAWSTLLQEDSERLATHPDVLYDILETEIMAMALQWKQSSGSIARLQQLAYEIIRKHDTMHKNSPDHDTKIARRQALQAIASFPIQMYSLTLFASESRTPPPEDILPLCAAGLTACLELRQYEPEGIQAMQRILAAYLPTLEKLAQQFSPSQQKAAHLAAQGYLLVNILADHYGRLDQMEAACRMARFYGRLAQSPNLEVSSLAWLASKYDLEHQDIKALETYKEALALPEFRNVSQFLRGRIYAGLAATYAYCQQSAPALSFLSQAKEHYPVDPDADPSDAFFQSIHYSPTGNALALWEGLTLKHTGHYSEAVGVFLQIGSLTPMPGLVESHRAEHLNYAASVAVKQREMEMACFYLDAAEEVAWHVAHEQRYTEVRDTLRSMRLLWPDEPKVTALQEKLYERQYA